MAPRTEPARRISVYRNLAGVIVAMAVVNLVYGITFPLLALVLDAQNVSKTLIGLSTMIQAVAILAVAPISPGLLARFSARRVMVVSAGLLSVLLILAGVFQNVYALFPIRFALGLLNGLLWIASEALINDLTPDHQRGRVIGVYASIGAAGFALGPLLLILTGSQGLLPFVVTCVVILFSILPLLWVHDRVIATASGTAAGFWRVFFLAPTIMLANLAYAAVVESSITFFPLFGMHFGLSEGFALTLMTLSGFGGMLLVLPLGWLADKVDKMGMLSAIVLLSALGLLSMPLFIAHPVLAPLLIFIIGGIEGMVYALGVMLVGERFKGAMLAGATTVFTTFWGVGTVIGPLVTGAGMDRFGAPSMAWILGAMLLVYLPWPLATWFRGRRYGRAADP